jgi:hypothetical protein
MKKDQTAATTNTDGTVDIPLSKPITIDGTKVTTLRMREPLVRDQLAVQGEGTDAEVELALIANLCNVDKSAFHALPLGDYIRVRTAFLGFIA